jgi:hypothetical protein
MFKQQSSVESNPIPRGKPHARALFALATAREACQIISHRLPIIFRNISGSGKAFKHSSAHRMAGAVIIKNKKTHEH